MHQIQSKKSNGIISVPIRGQCFKSLQAVCGVNTFESGNQTKSAKNNIPEQWTRQNQLI